MSLSNTNGVVEYEPMDIWIHLWRSIVLFCRFGYYIWVYKSYEHAGDVVESHLAFLNTEYESMELMNTVMPSYSPI